jgi:hypothetical protein
MRELVQIQQYAAGLRGLLATAQADAPRISEGVDRTGTIRAVLGPDGLPDSFRIESGWNRKITAETFGGAVLEAFQAAMGERLAVWTRTLEKQGWQVRQIGSALISTNSLRCPGKRRCHPPFDIPRKT